MRAAITIPLLLTTFVVSGLGAQVRPAGQTAELIELARGGSEIVRLSSDLVRVALADSSVVDAVVLSPREVLLNASTVGNTTMILWEANGDTRTYTVEVSLDVAPINRIYATLFPEEGLTAIAHGNVVVLSGTVSGAEVAQRMVEIATSAGGTIIRNYACIRPSVGC